MLSIGKYWVKVGLTVGVVSSLGVLCIILMPRSSVPRQAKAKGLLPLRFGLPLQPSSALMIIAHEKGYLVNQGLNVDIVEYPSGKRALMNGLFANEVDAVSSADLPVALAAFKRKDFKIIASTFSADNINRIIARRSADITKPADLKNRRIATQRNSAVHYFLHLFLLENNLQASDTSTSFMKAEELPTALVEKTIDAFSMREPFISKARDQLGDDAVIFSAPGIYEQMELVLFGEGFLSAHPEVAPCLIRALCDAERFAKEKPDEAMAMVAKRLKADPKIIPDLWASAKFRVTLSQGMVVLLEDEAQWAIDQKMVEQDEIPNFLRVINTTPLSKVKPEGINIF